MRDRPPATETLKISEVKQQLNRLTNRVYRHEVRVIIEMNGTPVAGIVSAEDLRRLDRLDRERAERFKVLEEFAEAFKDVPAEEIERETTRAIAEVRAEQRQKAAGSA